jgi:hypothetical protein
LLPALQLLFNASTGAMAKILLHGSLHVTIFEAEEISNSSRPSSQAPGFLRKVRDHLLFLLCNAMRFVLPAT